MQKKELLNSNFFVTIFVKNVDFFYRDGQCGIGCYGESGEETSV